MSARSYSCRVLHCWCEPGVAGSTDCHVSTNFQPFLPGLPDLPALIVALCFVSCTFSTSPALFPDNVLLWPLRLHVTELFHMPYCMRQIYGVGRGPHYPALRLMLDSLTLAPLLVRACSRFPNISLDAWLCDFASIAEESGQLWVSQRTGPTRPPQLHIRSRR